jgi:hypothetical protein
MISQSFAAKSAASSRFWRKRKDLMQDLAHWLRRAAVIAIIGMPAMLPAAALAGQGTGAIVSHLMIPLTGTISLPPDPCVPAGEPVSFTGDVHAVAILHRNGALFVHLNLADVVGTGASTGDTYLGVGAHNFPHQSFSAQLVLQHDFRLQSTEGCASQPLPVTVTLAFGGNGRVLPAPASSAQIASATAP